MLINVQLCEGLFRENDIVSVAALTVEACEHFFSSVNAAFISCVNYYSLTSTLISYHVGIMIILKQAH